MDSRRDFNSYAFDELWSELTKALCALPKVYCIVDALDEMSHGHDDFCAQLVALGELKPATLKVCITSRPVPRIASSLKTESIQKYVLDPAELQPAVSKYINFRLEHLRLTAVNMAAVQQQLLMRSTGLFLYVRLMMDELLDSQQIDTETILTKVKHLPNGLAAMYTHMLREHSIRTGIPQSLQVAILRWVTHSSRPLRLLELAAIIDSLVASRHLKGIEETRASYPNTKAMIRIACGPLVVILEDETVGIIHHSLTEYIVDSTRSDSTDINQAESFPTICSASSHREMALTCLRYPCNGWADEFWVETKGNSAERPSIESIYARYPFLRYACDYWTHHARLVVGNDPDLSRALDMFVDPSSRSIEAWYNRNPIPMVFQRTQKSRESVIHLAARQGLGSYIGYLLDRGHDANLRDDAMNTPLHSAAKTGYSAAAFELMRHVASIEQENDCGLKPLHEAAAQDHADVVKLLFEAGVDPMTPKTKEGPGRRCGNAPRTVGDTPLKYAFSYGHKKSALTIAPYLKSENLLQATYHAAIAGNSDIMLCMLDTYSFDINQRVDGKDLVFLAAYHHDIDVLQ